MVAAGEKSSAVIQYKFISADIIDIGDVYQLSVDMRDVVGFQFIHRTVKKVDAPIKSAQERIFFLFHHTPDKITLCGKFGEGIAHLLDEDR